MGAPQALRLGVLIHGAIESADDNPALLPHHAPVLWRSSGRQEEAMRTLLRLGYGSHNGINKQCGSRRGLAVGGVTGAVAAAAADLPAHTRGE
jgi:hypothetical protein